MNLVRLPPDKSGWAGLKFLCLNCNAVRDLDGLQSHAFLRDRAFNSDLKYLCRGGQPWFGQISSTESLCDKSPIATYLGAINAYFADTVSAITIPEKITGEAIKVKLEQLPLDLLDFVTLLNGHPQAVEKLKKLASEKAAQGRSEMAFVSEAQESELLNALGLLFGSDVTDTGSSELSDMRVREFRALAVDPPRELRPVLLPSLGTPQGISFGAIERATGFGWIEETRVLSGFTRVKPAEALSGPGTNGRRNLSQRDSVEWLPARKTYGDGIFLKFESEAIRNWRELADSSGRYARLERAIELPPWSGGRYQQSCDGGKAAAFVAIHSFSHALLGQIALWAGYNVASLKERVYAHEDGYGVLLYSNDGDADGSLGGLLAIGESGKLGAITEAAIERIRWCSNDPVCAERAHSEEMGRSLNLAACHSCLFLPETSCEISNQLLDRGSLLNPEPSTIRSYQGVFE
jgi:hypothetical protein